MVYYLDNIRILDKSKEVLKKLVYRVMGHLEDLGFIINKAKSELIPSKTEEHLGYKFSIKTMKISLPILKINKLHSRLNQAEIKTIRSCRWIASLLGKMTSVIPAIREVLLHIRYLQTDLA